MEQLQCFKFPVYLTSSDADINSFRDNVRFGVFTSKSWLFHKPMGDQLYSDAK